MTAHLKAKSLRLLACLIYAVFISSITGCLKSGGNGSSNGTDSEGASWLKLQIGKDSSSSTVQAQKGQPQKSVRFDKVIITITEVSVHSEEHGWIVVNPNSQTVDLVEVSTNAAGILADYRLLPGNYDQIRLKLSGEAYGIKDGIRTEIKVPSGAQSGIKLHYEFTIIYGHIASITLDFDPEKSVHGTGSGKYILKPVIGITDLVDADIVAPLIAFLSPTEVFSAQRDQYIAIEYSDTNLDASTLSVLIDDIESKHLFSVGAEKAEAQITLGEGTHTLEATVSDTWGNIGIAELRTITIDLTPPTIVGPSNPLLTSQSSFQIDFTLNDEASGLANNSIQVFIDGIEFTGNFLLVGDLLSGTVDLPEGEHTLVLSCKDNVGNATQFESKIIVDVTPPEISVSPISGTILQTLRPELVVNFADNLSGYLPNSASISLNDLDLTSNFTQTSTGFSGQFTSNLTAGINTFKISGKDAAGNSASREHNLIVGVEPIVITTSPGNQSVISNRQPTITAYFGGNFLDLASLNIKLNSIDTTSKFQVSETAAVLTDPGLLPLGENTLEVSLSNQFGQTETYLAIFSVTLPPPIAAPEPDEYPQSLPSNSKTISSNNLESVAITDITSPAYGAVVTFQKGSLPDNTEITVQQVDPTSVSSISLVEQKPGSFGPVIEITPSMELDVPVVVGIPYDKALYEANFLTTDDLIIIHHHEDANGQDEYELVKPFLVDEERGVMYAQVNSFSHFWPSYDWYSYFLVSVGAPNLSCLYTTSGQFCEARDRSIVFGGSIYTNIYEREQLQIECIGCPTGTIVEYQGYDWWTDSEKFTVSTFLENDIAELEIRTTAITSNEKLVRRSKFLIHQVPPLPQAPPSDRVCDTPGIMCGYIGNGSTAFANDGELAEVSPLNIYVDHPWAAIDLTSDSQDRLLWAEQTQSTFDATQANFKVRRRSLDGKIQSLADLSFQISDPLATFQGADIRKIQSNNDSGDNFMLAQFVGSEYQPIDCPPGVFCKITFKIVKVAYLKKISSFGVVSDVPIAINEHSSFAMGPENIVFINTSIGPNGSGIYKYDLQSNTISFLGGCSSCSHLPADGALLSQLNTLRIKDMFYLNGDIYFTSFYCIRKIDSALKVSTVAGICDGLYSPSGDRILATDARLGDVQSLELDAAGNLYFHESIPIRRFRAVRASNGYLETIVGGGSQALTISDLPLAALSVTLPNGLELFGVGNQARRYGSFGVDPQGNLYADGGAFIYRVAKPLEDLVVTSPSYSSPIAAPSTTESLSNQQLTEQYLIDLLISSQRNDGYWDFEEDYLGISDSEESTIRRFMATEKALEALKAAGLENSEAVEKALSWIANQDFQSTSMLARQVQLLSKFNVSDKYGSVQSSRQNILTIIGQRYRPSFSGWGSDAFSTTNNLDTSEALSALAAANSSKTQSTGHFVRISDYQISIIRLLSKQFDDRYGNVYEGGWGLLGPEAVPTLLVTNESIEALLGYAKMNPDDTNVIAAIKRSEFLTLRDNIIPSALQKAISYFQNQALADGSFGNVADTVHTLRTLQSIKLSGMISDIGVLGAIDDLMTGAISFLNATPLSTLDLGEVALLTDHLSHINRDISLVEDTTPEKLPSESEIADPLLGNGKDGSLVASGVFNLNKNASKGRSRPDGISYEVANLGSNVVHVAGYRAGDLFPGDEIVIYQAGGAATGLLEFARVESISDNSGNAAIYLASSLANSFSLTESVMLQRVPNYSHISTEANLVITADPWNGSYGGLIVARIAGTISSQVSIQASGLGYRGGIAQPDSTAYLSQQGESNLSIGTLAETSLGANGCGGANASVLDSASSGGGNHSLSDPTVSKLGFGCGGGSGSANHLTTNLTRGGAGGGAILIFANQYHINGTQSFIHADGESAFDSANSNIIYGSSGGAGGSIHLFVKDISIASDAVTAVGGSPSLGSQTFPGTQGANGHIRVNYSTLNSLSYPLGGSGLQGVSDSSPNGYGGNF